MNKWLYKGHILQLKSHLCSRHIAFNICTLGTKLSLHTACEQLEISLAMNDYALIGKHFIKNDDSVLEALKELWSLKGMKKAFP